MMRMIKFFLSVSKIDSSMHLKTGMHNINGVKGVEALFFHVQSRKSMEVAELLYVL